ncbi:transmembrane protein 209-like isoform X2 [Ostrea edulis]|uniref:transmembrane protein 209-like isoform X2 n=1 Tax=Ostrea edulis TaxID=37623 RepID=UPI0024AFF07A|nr:transmembrane protein 209-like isoform X2 [Ostrea edulis]
MIYECSSNLIPMWIIYICIRLYVYSYIMTQAYNGHWSVPSGMVKIGTFFNPVVWKTWSKQQAWRQARSSMTWCIINFCLAVLMYLELTIFGLRSYLDLKTPMFWYIECVIATLLLLNTVFHFGLYLRPYVTSSSVEMTPGQKTLLAIRDTDLGFKVSPQKSSGSPSSEGSLVFSVSTPTAQSSPSSGRLTPTNLGSGTINYSNQSVNFSPYSPASSYDRGSLSGNVGTPFSQFTASPNISGYAPNLSGYSPNVSGYSSQGIGYGPNLSGYSPNLSGYSPNLSGYSTNLSGYNPNLSGYNPNLSGYSPNMSSFSPGTVYTPSPNVSGFAPNISGYSPNICAFVSGSPGMTGIADTSGLRSRHSLSQTMKNAAASSSFDRITDLHSLSKYLREQDEKEYLKSAISSPENSGGSSFWSYGRTAMDYTHVLKKYVYQLASRSSHSLATPNNDNDQSIAFNGKDVWSKRGVTEDDLFLWIERLRKWVCLTIVSPLRKEIEEVNAGLRRIGSEDTEIGEVGVSTLKQLALTKGPYVPTLNAVVPYLDFSSNQEYLVKRIRDLGKDGCMSEFCWNSGGDYGKDWGEHLPTDAALVMHLFCTYMDSRLPTQPKYPDGKTFSAQHFIKTPDKPNLDKEDTVCLYQSSINPPHFQVVIGKTVHKLSNGRNNMFQALLLFLHHVDTKEHGMLGRVSLGMSGVNITWIFK